MEEIQDHGSHHNTHCKVDDGGGNGQAFERRWNEPHGEQQATDENEPTRVCQYLFVHGIPGADSGLWLGQRESPTMVTKMIDEYTDNVDRLEGKRGAHA